MVRMGAKAECKMKNAKCRTWLVATGAFADGDEDCDQLAGFVQQGLHLGCREKAFVPQQLYPVSRFIGLFQTVANLGNELRLRPCSIRFAIVGPNRCAGTQELSSQHLRHRLLWQCRKQSDHTPGKVLRARPQVFFCILHSAFYLSPFYLSALRISPRNTP